MGEREKKIRDLELKMNLLGICQLSQRIRFIARQVPMTGRDAVLYAAGKYLLTAPDGMVDIFCRTLSDPDNYGRGDVVIAYAKPGQEKDLEAWTDDIKGTCWPDLLTALEEAFSLYPHGRVDVGLYLWQGDDRYAGVELIAAETASGVLMENWLNDTLEA